jgi:hypothetical protein
LIAVGVVSLQASAVKSIVDSTSKSKCCSWLVKLHGRNTTFEVAEKCDVFQVGSTLINKEQDFGVFIAQLSI